MLFPDKTVLSHIDSVCGSAAVGVTFDKARLRVAVDGGNISTKGGLSSFLCGSPGEVGEVFGAWFKDTPLSDRDSVGVMLELMETDNSGQRVSVVSKQVTYKVGYEPVVKEGKGVAVTGLLGDSGPVMELLGSFLAPRDGETVNPVVAILGLAIHREVQHQVGVQKANDRADRVYDRVMDRLEKTIEKQGLVIENLSEALSGEEVDKSKGGGWLTPEAGEKLLGVANRVIDLVDGKESGGSGGDTTIDVGAMDRETAAALLSAAAQRLGDLDELREVEEEAKAVGGESNEGEE